MKNHVTLIGRIGNDVELKELDHSKVVNISIHVDDNYLNDQGEKVERGYWFPLFAQGNIAEQIHKNFKKGDQIAIFGKLRTRRFYNKTSEREEMITEIYVNGIEYLASRNK